MVVDKTSASGLFNHFLTGHTVPILCVNDACTLLNKITSNGKTSSQRSFWNDSVNVSMENSGMFRKAIKGENGLGVSSG